MSRDNKTPRRDSGRFAYDGLERAIHEKARLGILTSLMTRRDGLLFTELKQLCSLTDGNLNRHLKVLQDAGLVDVWKGSQKKKPQTLCRLTPEGRRRFLEYVAVLEQVVSDAATAATTATSKVRGRNLLEGWSPA
ncbi:MAG TPA: transcriptional regulator [Planctomycetaceae bacterium]|jgi:DNA-binding HxlR family transcriptional regulator|nr:transcriptional regulator [Planctomycetaceae bacterium]